MSLFSMYLVKVEDPTVVLSPVFFLSRVECATCI